MNPKGRRRFRFQPWIPDKYVITIATSEFSEVIKPYRESVKAYASRLATTRYCIEVVDEAIHKMMGNPPLPETLKACISSDSML